MDYIEEDQVKRACEILTRINPKATGSPAALNGSERVKFPLDRIIGIGDEKAQKWQMVYMNVENMTPQQQKLWDQLSPELPYTSCSCYETNEIKFIGWSSFKKA